MTTELVQLRSYYAEPGFLLLARVGDEPAACVGVRALTPSTGELRRLFVRPEQRTRGLGRSLLDQATQLARGSGFQRLVLTTLPTMKSARRLYDLDGYVPVDSYVAEPVDGVEYLGLDL